MIDPRDEDLVVAAREAYIALVVAKTYEAKRHADDAMVESLAALRARLADGPTVDVRGFLWCPSDMDTVFLVPLDIGMAPDIEMGAPEGLLILARSLDGRRVITSVCTRLLPTGEVQHTLVAIRPEWT